MLAELVGLSSTNSQLEICSQLFCIVLTASSSFLHLIHMYISNGFVIFFTYHRSVNVDVTECSAYGQVRAEDSTSHYETVQREHAL